MRYLVTGGAGFIGSHLVDRLVEYGHEVIVLDNLSSGFREQINPKAWISQQRILLGGNVYDHGYFDSAVSGDWIDDVFANVRFDGIFHCAAIARTPWCIEDPRLCAYTNIGGTINALEAARKFKVPRVVLCSSNVVYAANTPYKVSKLCGEMWGAMYAEFYGVSNLSLRFSNVYGPRQSEWGPSPNVFAALRKSLREKGYMEITGDGTQRRHYTHVRDIVSGLVAAMKSDYVGAPIDLCTPFSHSLIEVAKLWGAWPDRVRFIPERVGDIHDIPQEPSRAAQVLGWLATIPLEDGIKDVVDSTERRQSGQEDSIHA